LGHPNEPVRLPRPWIELNGVGLDPSEEGLDPSVGSIETGPLVYASGPVFFLPDVVT